MYSKTRHGDGDPRGRWRIWKSGSAGEIDLRYSLLQHFAEISVLEIGGGGFLLSFQLDSLATQMAFCHQNIQIQNRLRSH